MASNVDAKSVVEDITTTAKLLDAKQSTNTPSTAASSTKSENYFTANDQHQQDSESEEEQQSQSDNESMNEDDDNSDAMSEYSYCISDDGEEDEEQEVYDHTKKSIVNKIQPQPVSVTHAGAKRKGKCFVGFVIYCYVIRIVYC